MIITIDGPTASGKSTLARNLASKLKIYYLNSGLLYRSLAYLLVHKFNYNNEKLVNPDQADIEAIFNAPTFVDCFDGNDSSISFDGEDITSKLKSSEIDKYSSIISANPRV